MVWVKAHTRRLRSANPSTPALRMVTTHGTTQFSKNLISGRATSVGKIELYPVAIRAKGGRKNETRALGRFDWLALLPPHRRSCSLWWSPLCSVSMNRVRLWNGKVVNGTPGKHGGRQVTAHSLRHAGILSAPFTAFEDCFAELCVLLTPVVGVLAFSMFSAPAPVMEYNAPAPAKVCICSTACHAGIANTSIRASRTFASRLVPRTSSCSVHHNGVGGQVQQISAGGQTHRESA